MNNHNLYMAKPGASTVKNDFQTAEWGREANAGFKIGRSSNPVFFTQDGHNVKLEDCAKGSSILICDGNVNIDYDLGNVHVWAANKAINKYPCSIWTPSMDVASYNSDYWKSPAFMKILPLQAARLKRNDGKLVSHSPYCFYYRRHTSFNAANFVTEETVWYDESEGSDVLAALKLAIIMGYRNIFLAANVDAKSKTFQHLQQINKILNDSKINIYNCGNINLFPTTDIAKACRSCILR